MSEQDKAAIAGMAALILLVNKAVTNGIGSHCEKLAVDSAEKLYGELKSRNLWPSA